MDCGKLVKLKTMIKEVTNCNDCPFAYDGGYEGETYYCSIDVEIRAVYNNGWDKKPKIQFHDVKDWCPLKKEDYLIKLKT